MTRSILDHEAEGRALRVFKGASGEVEYVGEFVLDKEEPWYETDAPETWGGPVRKVIVFKPRPVDTAPPTFTGAKIAEVVNADVVKRVLVEEQRTEKMYVDLDREPYEAERGESRLVKPLAAHLRGRDHEVCRLHIVPEGEYKPLFTDLYDVTVDLLIEAKGSVTREAIFWHGHRPVEVGLVDADEPLARAVAGEAAVSDAATDGLGGDAGVLGGLEAPGKSAGV